MTETRRHLLFERIVRQLCTPLNYLRVRHPTKLHYDVTIPIIASTLITALVWYLPFDISIFGEVGVVASGSGILQILTGFYIAALAAVSTFPSASIEGRLEGADVTLAEYVHGERRVSVLNRRRFLSLLFGYLAFVSLTLYALGAVANVLAPGVAASVAAEWKMVVKHCFLFVYLSISFNLVTSTLLGLYYLSYRLHLPERRGTSAQRADLNGE